MLPRITSLLTLLMVGTATAARPIALYDFASADGDTVYDRSGVGQPLHLKIDDTGAVSRKPGSLTVNRSTRISSGQAARKITDAVHRSRELTVEAWITSADTNQDGPARVLTISKNSSERNLTLGQDGGHYDVRLRSTKTSTNGIPSTAAKKNSLAPRKLTHLVYTRDNNGRTTIYLDGQRHNAGTAGGDLGNWDNSHRLALGNEFSGDRPWRGTYHRLAIYDRALPPPTVSSLFQAGAAGSLDPAAVATQPDPGARFFETRIAPILARHCLECHDTSSKKGKLNLAQRTAALAGGKNGKPLVPGNPHDSLLWQSIESDEMPDDRPPLSDEEKRLVKQWIESGAHWSLNEIDRLLYANTRDDGKPWVRRLTVPEYIATVQATVGVDIADEARETLPRDLRADGFSNTAYNLNVDFEHVEAYAKLAALITGRMDIKAFADRFHRNRKFTDKEMGKLIESMGAWVLRGPVDNREVVLYRGISTTVASAGGTYDEAVALILEAMLQSPRFIYQIENQRGDGTPWPVTPHELASRLSYAIWGASPDRELLGAADAGKLSAPGDLARHVQRMLDDPRARTQAGRFASEWLNLGRLANLNPNKATFPAWDVTLASDMRAETLAVFDEIAWQKKRPLYDLFNAQFTHVTPRLAKHYGIRPVADTPADESARYDLSKTPSRGGILTQGSILTIGGDEASMVTRGLFVLHDVLRGVVSDPPPGLDTTPVPSEPGLPQRKIAEERIADRSCGGCHSKFEPLAFGLERYDGLGAYHAKDHHGNDLRQDGEVLIPGADKAVPYDSSAKLMDILAGSPRVRETITWKLAQFILGRPIGAADAGQIAKVHARAMEQGYTYHALVTAITTSPLVTHTRTEPDS